MSNWIAADVGSVGGAAAVGSSVRARGSVDPATVGSESNFFLLEIEQIGQLSKISFPNLVW